MTDHTVDGVADMPSELRAFDVLMHRGEANPRSRSGMMSVQILDTTPTWDRFYAGIDSGSRRVLRMRQKVIMPTLPTASPRWVVDPDFNLDYHVRRLRVPEPGTVREVLDVAEVMVQSPMDVSRPLWTITLVEGLSEGRAALLFHMSHAVTDGLGGIEMFSHIYDLDQDAPQRPAAPMPVPEDLSPNDVMRQGFNDLPGKVVGGVRGALSSAARIIGRFARDPATVAGGIVEYSRSIARVVGPTAEPSPLLRRRSLASRTEAIDVKLSDLHRAAKAADGSINDAYLASLCGALRRYHDALGMPVSSLPMAIPVSLRADDDPAGGNHFAGVTLAAPIDEPDPAIRIKAIRAQMLRRREEPAIDVFGMITPVLQILPGPMLDWASSAITPADVQASNVPGSPTDMYIAGAKVLRQYGLGPLPGVAMMVLMTSLAGMCTVSVRYDRSSVTDERLFAQCLCDGFDEVLALGGSTARSVPASFVPSTAADREGQGES
jgi:diacylglycerol O-acyltransferase / wax synthase